MEIKQHFFDVALAEKYGVEGAIILSHLIFWLSNNRSKGVNYVNGRYWEYTSIKALAKFFPYWNERQVHHAVQKLIEAGALITENFNGNKMNRTLWYALSDELFENVENEPLPVPARQAAEPVQTEPALPAVVESSVITKPGKSIEERDATLKARAKKFGESVAPFIPTYGRDMCLDFWRYWTEPNKSHTKLRYELEKTWDVSRRLVTWSNRQKGFRRDNPNKPSEDTSTGSTFQSAFAQSERVKQMIKNQTQAQKAEEQAAAEAYERNLLNQ